jgi:hypothetical protein
MHHTTDVALLMSECAKVDSLTGLRLLAEVELHKFIDGAEIVCGPISTGGRGSVEANMKAFEATVTGLLRDGRPIFSQIPYEEKIFFFRERFQAKPGNAGKYYLPILYDFYLPLFETGRIKKGWFLPGWESSFGARWEREQLQLYRAEIEDLSLEWVEEVLV